MVTNNKESQFSVLKGDAKTLHVSLSLLKLLLKH